MDSNRRDNLRGSGGRSLRGIDRPESDGGSLAVGAPQNGVSPYLGYVRVLDWTGGSWVPRPDLSGSGSWSDLAGTGVDISHDGSVVAVGVPVFVQGNPSYTEGPPHVRVFKWDSVGNSDIMAWAQLGGDVHNGAEFYSIGYAVKLSASGDSFAAFVADPACDPWETTCDVDQENETELGRVRVYDWSGAREDVPSDPTWEARGEDVPFMELPYDDCDSVMGHCEWLGGLALSGDGMTFAAGITGGTAYNGNGRVFVYRWSGVSWAQLGPALVGEETSDNFGYSVALNLDGSRLAVGAPGDDGAFNANDGYGAVRVYGWEAGTTNPATPGGWAQIGLDIDGTDVNGAFGTGVSLSDEGDKVGTGGFQCGSQRAYNGHVRVFEAIAN